MPHGVGVEASFPLRQDVIGWRQSKTRGEILREKVVVRHFARSNPGLWSGDTVQLDSSVSCNDFEIKHDAEESKLYRMAMVHYFLKMWQGRENLWATQKASPAQIKQMTAMGYISDTEETVKASWSAFKHDGVATFKLTEKSQLRLSLSQIDLPSGKTHVLNIKRICRINCHSGESDDESSAETNSDTEDWLHRNGDLDNPQYDENDVEADYEDDIILSDDSNVIDQAEQLDVYATPYIAGHIWPVQKLKCTVTIVVNRFAPVSMQEIQNSKGNK
jgi:hypothetical protein